MVYNDHLQECLSDLGCNSVTKPKSGPLTFPFEKLLQFPAVSSHWTCESFLNTCWCCSNFKTINLWSFTILGLVCSIPSSCAESVLFVLVQQQGKPHQVWVFFKTSVRIWHLNFWVWGTFVLFRWFVNLFSWCSLLDLQYPWRNIKLWLLSSEGVCSSFSELHIGRVAGIPNHITKKMHCTLKKSLSMCI